MYPCLRSVGVLALLLAGLSACDSGNPASPESQPQEPTAAEMLQERPALTSKKAFTAAYSQPVEFLTGAALNEEQSRELLVSFADKNPLVDTKRALELFDHPTMKSVIADPGLRAMYAGLNGMLFGNRSIEFILNAKTPSGLPKVKRIAYGPVRPGLVAEVVTVHSNGQMTIHFNSNLGPENPMKLAGYGVHELLHQDLRKGAHGDENEEVFAHTAQTLVTLALMATNPELFDEPTRLTQINTNHALGLYNTGLGPKLGILESNGNAPIYPGSTNPLTKNVRAFADRFSGMDDTSTPGNALVEAFTDELARVAGTASCPAEEFNRRLLECMDRLIGDVSVAPDSPVNPFSVEKRANPIAEVLGIRGDLLAKAKAKQ